MKKIWLAASIVALTSSGAIAADVFEKGSTKDGDLAGVRVQNWSGVYVGAQFGAGHTVIGAEEGQGGISLDGPLGGIRAGIDIARGSFLIGAYGEYNWSDEAIEIGGLTLLQQDHDWAAMARLGIIHGNTLFYGAGGYTVVSYSSGPSSVDVDGWKAAVGIEHALAPNLTLGLEASRSWLDADDFLGSGAEDYVDITDDRVLARLTYKINGYTFGF
jgi:outer membrane immunogenic protein